MYIAVEFKPNNVNISTKGYLKVPDSFTGAWASGFIQYLKDTYSTNHVDLYPLNKAFNVYDGTVEKYNGKITYDKNMEDDFNMAIRSLKYYPRSDFNDGVRRAWTKSDQMNSDYIKKER